ncbi:hypothetical protein ACPCHT_38570 [Nucisporomicrobium flavum]|uniref:hypothetical protein n=1 Tax=Nucisporomicrobium flavum TaxID=2785915 RepID=UPI003C2D64E7
MDLWNDTTNGLVAILDVAPDQLAETIGHAWVRAAPPAGELCAERIWFVSGDPPQVMLGVSIEDVSVAVPEVQ